MRPTSILFLALATQGTSATVFKRASTFAARHTKSLARDLRVAFGGILPRDSASNAQHVIYCKNSPPSGVLGSGSNSDSGVGSGSSLSSGVRSGPASTTKKGSTPTGSAKGPSATSPWQLTQSYAGSNFFDGWDFWDTDDPTHGTVQYVSRADGQSAGLIEINSAGNAVMRVDTTPSISGNRKSIRITTQKEFTGGLIILDAFHAPTGCGTWPAFWSNGPNWPVGGEIDIVEGVSDYTNNQATIHTAPGCALTTDNPAKLNASASAVTGGTDCAAATSGNAGCGMRSADNKSFGPGFNSNGGGVYAMLWQSSGISVFFFERGDIPDHIDAGAPQPDKWGLPMAHWPAAVCDPWKYFYKHVAIINTSLCGDWAGSAWTSSGIPGQEQSCAQRTGFSTCSEFVQKNGGSFAQAYWEIKSVKFYNTTAPL
ncbi:GH16 domain-containing protein [Mycena indigotica]|uniref:GH16 domain-containing protein n=1 Tax=Mycena indigotica TaxID=2126181 RepID=A0A8H6SW84_9AGAR|nr:GH16 domain-containing protein [Mycena indigotica]KAF7306514.1 GH16 domain-containing protein [Mycena indigotica]